MSIQGIAIIKTLPSHFERIYPLLLTFDSPFSKEDWKRLFYYDWEGKSDHVGYHLEKDDEVVGFMGLIFSARYIKNQQRQFCNITSLIVKPNYRAATILFIRKLLTYRDIIFTGLGPIDESFRLLKAIGFIPFETHYKIIPVLNGLLSKQKYFSTTAIREVLEKLDLENKRIFLDHEKLKCHAIFFEINNENTVCIYSIGTQKYYGITVKKIYLHYVSNHLFFNRYLKSILKEFRKKIGIISAVYADKRIFFDTGCILSFDRQIFPPKICNKYADSIFLDSLYSEAVLL